MNYLKLYLGKVISLKYEFWPAADKDGADTQNHGCYPVEKFEAPVVNTDLVWSNNCGDHFGEGTEEHVGHDNWPISYN